MKHQKNTRLITKVNFTFSGEEIENPIQIRIFTFKGENYDFIVTDAVAHDKPKGWHLDYINPGRMTIPQTNLRIGYFISDHYNISIGLDHMKYVLHKIK